MIQPSSIKKIPEIMWFQVFKYFSIQEFVTMRQVNKELKECADNYADIYERECIRIFTSDLQLFEYAKHENLLSVSFLLNLKRGI